MAVTASAIRTTSSPSADGAGSLPRPAIDAATAYARAVVDGDVVACVWTRLACARHLRDLEHGHERGLWWDAEQVEDQRLYFAGLHHSKGEWAGQPIRLEPFQLFILGSLYGWKRADGTRRFRIAYVEISRKAGKSTIAAGVGNYLAFDDDEAGAEVYSFATKRDQAKIVWNEAKRMVLRTPTLRTRITALVANLSDHVTGSKFEPLGADADNLDGLHIHGAIVDELHAHKTRALWDVIDTATAARRQPLIFAITTAGSNRAGVCYEQRSYLTKILEGVLDADDYFGIIFTIDAGDSWRDPACWPKAIPMLGVSVRLEEVQAQATRADEMPSAQAAFQQKRLNVWTHADEQFLPTAAWQRCASVFTLDALRGVPCWIGIDLASKSDLAAVVAVFVRADGVIWMQPRFYLPADAVQAASHDVTAHFAGWAASGHLTLTEGALIDFSVIREDIKRFARGIALQKIAYDPYQATQVATELRAEFGETVVIEIPQTVKSLSGPMKAWRDLAQAGRFHHDGNPLMTWCVSNLVAREDANENVFPRKTARHLKIDGVSALLNALAPALVALAQPASRYLSQGVRVLGQ